MTQFDYLKARRKAATLLSRYGTTAILTQAGAMVGPAWAATPGDPIETPVTVATMSQKQAPAVDGLAARLLKTLLMAAPTYATPIKGNAIMLGGIAHEIIDVRPFAPAAVVVYFEVDAVA